jgi:hypothetical protein
MGLIRKFRAIIGSGLVGEPPDGKSAPWQPPYETLRKSGSRFLSPRLLFRGLRLPD